MDANIFRIHKHSVSYSNFGVPHYLLPFGDIHRDSRNCDVKLWLEWCKWAAKKPRAMFLGMGDYFDNFSTSERNGLNSINLHESSKENLDDFVRGKCQAFAKEIGFMRGKIVGMLEGNHHYVFGSGITSSQYLCELLGCQYLGCAAIVRLAFHYSKGAKRSAVDMFVYHGKGASRLVGGSLNTVQQMSEAVDGVQIFLMGHDHKKSVGMASKLCLTDGQNGIHLRERKQLFCRTGSFLQGYVEGRPSYVAAKLLNPTDLGTVKIELTPKIARHAVDGKLVSDTHVIDIHASI